MPSVSLNLDFECGVEDYILLREAHYSFFRRNLLALFIPSIYHFET